MRFKMSKLVSTIKSYKYFRLSLFLQVSLLLLSGCALSEINEQANIVENSGTIKGEIKTKSTHTGPVIVERFRVKSGIFIGEDRVTASATGSYKFSVNPGRYYIAAFIDTNNDGISQENEPYNYYGKPTEIAVHAKDIVIVETITITDTPPIGAEKISSIVNLEAPEKNIGRIVSMSDPMMNSDYYSTGLWRPFDFIDQVGGGLFLLQEYDAMKIPVLFVHGINGGPKNWEKLIENMDSKKFQPWLLYYPSGVRLDMVSDYMVKAVSELQNKFKFKRINIIAHSMGGLVTRSFIKKYVEQFPKEAKDIGLVMTINSPMGGMASAASGVKYSPIVVSSWRDVAAGSDFLKNIQKWTWPQFIDYRLVFSYDEDENGDGVVLLKSQIPTKLQAEATRIYGFNDSHAGILLDEKFFTLFNTIMAESIK